MLTAGELGPGFAGARLVAAFGMGLVVGYATWALQRRGLLENPLKGHSSCSTSPADEPDKVVRAFWQKPDLRAAFDRVFRKTGFFLAKWLTLAFLLGA